MTGHMTVSAKPNGRRKLTVQPARRFRTSQDDANSKLDAVGIEGVCDVLLNGSTLIQYAELLKIDLSQLLHWILADPGRSARMRECRSEAAIVWDERCELLLAGSRDAFELSKARELAHHYRWRASKIAPRIYGDHARIEHTGAAGGPIIVSTGLPTDGLQPKADSVPTDGQSETVRQDGQ